jgi:hypothetical protein
MSRAHENRACVRGTRRDREAAPAAGAERQPRVFARLASLLYVTAPQGDSYPVADLRAEPGYPAGLGNYLGPADLPAHADGTSRPEAGNSFLSPGQDRRTGKISKPFSQVMLRLVSHDNYGAFAGQRSDRDRGHILLKAQLIRLFTNYFLPPAACLQIISSPGRYQA